MSLVEIPEFTNGAQLRAHLVEVRRGFFPKLPSTPRFKPQKLEPETITEPARIIELDIERAIRQAQEIVTRMTVSYEIPEKRPGLDSILKQVCKFYGFTEYEIKAYRREKRLVLARQVGFFLSKILTGHSFPIIGKFYRKDHTTVLYGVRKIARLRKCDDRLRDEIELLIIKIREAA